MAPKLCMRYLIKGRVQGVFYRASAQDEAKKLGITGWARNLPDGRVEVLACGENEKLLAFHSWLKSGPEHAEVESVESEELPWKEYDRFAVM